MLFCGIVSALYVRPNMSPRGQDQVGSFFKLLSTLAETSVFLFVGASVFLDQQALSWDLLPFVVRRVYAAVQWPRCDAGSRHLPAGQSCGRAHKQTSRGPPHTNAHTL